MHDHKTKTRRHVGVFHLQGLDMLKIDSSGATVDNLFTEGAPSLGTPATVVSAKWLNTVQEEIVNVVLAGGLSLDQSGADVSQLREAINVLISRGGNLQTFTLDNDVQTASPINALTFDSSEIVSAKISFDIQRRTDSNSVAEAGEIICNYNNEESTWSLALESYGDDAEVYFEISAAGLISYTSSDLVGGTYAGELRVNNIKIISQAV